MRFSLAQRLRATRERLGMTQEQVIEILENRYNLLMSQQMLSYIENGKRKVDAERELPALAAVYGKPIDYFYQTLQLPKSSLTQPLPRKKSVTTVNLEALTNRDKLELVAELIGDLLEQTNSDNLC